tara:strand:+ start:163 stop:474 length:312 start_codon:yes stop_codon:yes gene_type:complete
MEKNKVTLQGFLEECSAHGITTVAVNRLWRRLDACKTWKMPVENVVFTNAANEAGKPAIWNVVEKMGLSERRGVGHQAFIDMNADLVEEGVFRFVNGKWEWIE